MKIGIYILNIDDYFPELWRICLPTIQKYADKISANLIVITERKYPDWHLSYEKAQVYELGKENDWNIVMDSDVIIHPDMPDLTKRVPDFAVGIRDSYPADSLFKLQPYFYRDRRKVGISGVLAMASKYCHDFWTPLPDTQTDHIQFIQPWDDEIKRGVDPSHFITEYWQSSNLARYGLQFSGILNEDERWMFHHSYTARNDSQKLEEMRDVIQNWQLV